MRRRVRPPFAWRALSLPVLKTYNLSTAAPQRWESGDGLDEFGATATGGGRADEPDPLGLHRVGILACAAGD